MTLPPELSFLGFAIQKPRSDMDSNWNMNNFQIEQSGLDRKDLPMGAARQHIAIGMYYFGYREWRGLLVDPFAHMFGPNLGRSRYNPSIIRKVRSHPGSSHPPERNECKIKINQIHLKKMTCFHITRVNSYYVHIYIKSHSGCGYSIAMASRSCTPAVCDRKEWIQQSETRLNLIMSVVSRFVTLDLLGPFLPAI